MPFFDFQGQLCPANFPNLMLSHSPLCSLCHGSMDLLLAPRKGQTLFCPEFSCLLPYLSSVSLAVTFSKSLSIRIPPKVHVPYPHPFPENWTLFLPFIAEAQGMIYLFLLTCVFVYLISIFSLLSLKCVLLKDKGSYLFLFLLYFPRSMTALGTE